MIQLISDTKKETVKIVLDAMRTMQNEMHQCIKTEEMCMCANAIAALASTLEEKPNFVFGDVNTMEEGSSDDD